MEHRRVVPGIHLSMLLKPLELRFVIERKVQAAAIADQRQARKFQDGNGVGHFPASRRKPLVPAGAEAQRRIETKSIASRREGWLPCEGGETDPENDPC